MKKLLSTILSFNIIALLTWCCNDFSTVEPITNDGTTQIKKIESLPIDEPIKNNETKELRFITDYNFNPSDENNMYGGFLEGNSFVYKYDNEILTDEFRLRYITNAKIYVPAKMKIDQKTVNVCYIYTLNRNEKVLKNNIILEGKTWGTFKIVQDVGIKPKDNCEALFQGEFYGTIDKNITKLNLSGKGLQIFDGRFIKAHEEQICSSIKGELKCWTSHIEGKISPKLFVEN